MDFALEQGASAAETRSFQEVRIENTNRCGYRCHFCPREAMTREQGMMSLEDLGLVLSRVGMHEGRVDLHGFGEPLLDKLLVSKTALVHRGWPNASPTIYSTLGVPVPEGYFEELLDAGLAELHVSFYGATASSYRKAHGVQQYQLAWSNLQRLRMAARIAPSFRLVLRNHPLASDSERDGAELAALNHLLREWQDAGGAVVSQRMLHNFGNGRKYNASGTGAACSVVWGFRKRVLQVTWDLKVVPCCFDFNSTIVLGDLRQQTLDEIFTSATYRQFIDAHVEDRLHDYPVCSTCERCRLP